MKTKIIALFTLLLFSGNVFSKETELGKSIAPFLITKRTTDTNLGGKSKFNFTFVGTEKSKNTTIEFGMNEATSTLETNGQSVAIKNTVPGKYILYFYLVDHFEVISDTVEIKKNEVIDAQIYFQKADVIITVDKPVIYLYPEKEMSVNVKIEGSGKLGFTYPNYANGWNFTAKPDGKLLFGNKTYNYLFYESDISSSSIPTEKNIATGFIVSSDTLLSFLENSLATMGFTSSESADFITYWYPQMIKNEKNFIHFLFNDACNAYAELTILPKPDHIFRVGMIWGETSTTQIPVPQIIPFVKREGFTAIEWGGIEMDWVIEK